jgi:lysophospholipase L1-like esterase
LWDQVLADLRSGDFVLIQFGHNDGGQLFEGDRPRASLKGNGDETQEGVVAMTGKSETVRSFGWYLRRYIADAKAKGATPIVLSPVPRNIWRRGRVARAANDYGKWAAEAAKQGGARFIDLNELIAGRYEQAGRATVDRDYFTAADHTHTGEAGAHVNAECVVAGIRGLDSCKLTAYLRRADGSLTPLDEAAAIHRFNFGSDESPAGYALVTADTTYSDERGYGFEPGATTTSATIASANSSGVDSVARDYVTSDTPFYFSVALPEGNYRVTATLAAADDAAQTTIKAELRRLMVEGFRTPPGEPATCTFMVNVRTPRLPDGGSVRLKDRERTSEAWAWDDKLTLEFNGPQPRLAALEIAPAPDAPTVYLLGDSTVCDQALEPWNSWGQMLPCFLAPPVAVANHAESGESIRSSLGARRFDKVFSLIEPGDYLFVQFGHNDMKESEPDALTTYRSNLESIVERTRKLGATPVLVTSMERKAGIDADTLAGYPQTVRDVAREKRVALIDLHATSKVLYRALGDDLDAAFQDGTHHTSYGSYLLAKCVVEAIRASELSLLQFIVADVPPFDPNRPDKFATFGVPASPR